MVERGTRHRFFVTLWLATMFVSLAPALWIAHESREDAAALVSRAVEDELNVSANAVVSYTELWVDGVIASLQELAHVPAMADAPRSIRMDYDVFDAARSNPDDARRPLLKAALPGRPYLRVTFFVRGSDGLQTARSDDAYLLFVADRGYFREAMAGRPGLEIIRSRLTDQPSLAVAVPVRDAANAIVGAVVAIADLESVSAEIARVTRGMPWRAIVLDKQGNAAANPYGLTSRREAAASAARSGSARRRGADPDLIRFTEGDRELVAISRVTKHGWTVRLERDAPDAYASAHLARIGGTKLVAVAIAVVVLSSLVLSRWFASRFDTVLAKTDRLWASTLHLERSLSHATLARSRVLTRLVLVALGLACVFMFYRGEDIGVPLGALVVHALYMTGRRLRAGA